MASTFHIFAEYDFDAVSRSRIEELKLRIHSEDKNYLLNVNRTEYVDHLVSAFEIAALGLNFDGVEVSTSEQEIPAEYFPSDFAIFWGDSHPKPVVKYHIPFSGDDQPLHFIPNPRVHNSRPVSVENGEVCFEIIDFYGDPERIKRDADPILNLIRQQASYLEKNITQYNESLRQQAESLFDKRKAEVMKQNQVVAALGVPIKKASDVPKTFAVPAARKQVIPRPQASMERYSPEPALDEAIYEEILQTIFDTGRFLNGSRARAPARTRRPCGIISY